MKKKLLKDNGVVKLHERFRTNVLLEESGIIVKKTLLVELRK